MNSFTSGICLKSDKNNRDTQLVLDTGGGRGEKYFFPYAAAIPPGKPKIHAEIML